MITKHVVKANELHSLSMWDIDIWKLAITYELNKYISYLQNYKWLGSLVFSSFQLFKVRFVLDINKFEMDELVTDLKLVEPIG